MAVDFSDQLLSELSARSFSNIATIHSDILDFLRDVNHPADLIVCMGDTLTHLKSVDDVSRLLQMMSGCLKSDGTAIFSFQGLFQRAQRWKRFIPLKVDQNRILTCFLEYFDNHVMVYDVLHENQGAQWIQKISCYPKIRLGQQLISELLRRHQLQVNLDEVRNGMAYIIAKAEKWCLFRYPLYLFWNSLSFPFREFAVRHAHMKKAQQFIIFI